MQQFNPYPKPVKQKKVSRIDAWNKIRDSVVKPVFKKLNINYCEVARFLYAQGMISEEQAYERSMFLSFHHRHKRNWYKQFDREKEEKLLGSFNQVIMVGQYYHNMLEHNKDLTARWFLELRGEEEL